MDVRYINSAISVAKCPSPDLPEYAFLGRSNVGKSSLINMITGTGNMARVSAKPGKTQLINHFVVDEKWYLVDLPGYGYARASKSLRAGWGKMIFSYLAERQNLLTTFLLIDARHPIQENDHEVITWFGEHGIPFLLAFTKIDKLSSGQLAANVDAYKKALENEWEELPPLVMTSARTGEGRNEILDYIKESSLLFRR